GGLALGHGAHAFELEQVGNPGDRLLDRTIRVVEVRRALQAREALRRRRVIEVIRMKLAAERPEVLLEHRAVDSQLARQAKEGKVISLPPERQDLGALRAEVHVDRRTTAAGSADLKNDGSGGFGSHC